MKNVIAISVAPHETARAAVEITPHVSVGSAGSSGFGAAIRTLQGAWVWTCDSVGMRA